MQTACRRLAAVLASTLGALALFAPAANAGPISDNADCTAQPAFSQVFMPWLDLANYGLSPDGGLEGGAAGWTLTGGAAVGAGNESFFVGGGSDASSLSLPAGSRATSAPTCVGLEWPTIRFFARSSGTGLLSSLRTEVLFEDGLTGAVRALPIGTVLPSSYWAPTTQMVMIVNTFGALMKDGMIPVAFRFTPVGSGSWEIDDLYVDPYRGP
jgi:hypothetical protein